MRSNIYVNGNNVNDSAQTLDGTETRTLFLSYRNQWKGYFVHFPGVASIMLLCGCAVHL